MKKICKNCKYYKLPGYNTNENGECSCKKFKYIEDHHQHPLDDQLLYWDAEDYGAGFEVGPNFGCIHWKPKKDKIENQ